jgi:hypothetical protein
VKFSELVKNLSPLFSSFKYILLIKRIETSKFCCSYIVHNSVITFCEAAGRSEFCEKLWTSVVIFCVCVLCFLMISALWYLIDNLMLISETYKINTLREERNKRYTLINVLFQMIKFPPPQSTSPPRYSIAESQNRVEIKKYGITYEFSNFQQF